MPTALERVQAHRAKRSAQTMMVDASAIVETSHKGSIKNYFKHTASQAYRTTSTSDAVSMGTGLALTGAVVIAGLATGGLAIPLLIGLGAGGWALKKAITEIGNDYNRQNRNWLQRYNGATGSDTKEQAALLTCEAGDAIRRAIDHYRAMVNTIIPNELRPQDQGQYATCEDAINHVKAVARFIHHGDKVRNYALPALDLLTWYLERYDALAESWDTWEKSFNTALVAWFASHPNASCAAGTKDVCYAPNASVGTFPRKPHPSGLSNHTLPVGDAAEADPGAVEIADLVAAMKKAREKVIAGMHVSSSKTWNYSAERPATARVSSGSSSTVHMQKRRLDLMIDAVWQQVDRPGYFTRAGRRMEHWYTRHNKTEKIGSIFSEITSVGSIFLPFLKGVDTLSDVAKSAISGSISATTTISDKVGMSLLKAKGQAPIHTGLINRATVKASAEADARGSGVTVQKLMPKLMTHFGNAAEVMKDLEGAAGPITSCNQAFGLALRAAELVHEMEKVNRYIGPCIGLTDFLCAACDKWAEQEDDIWRDMEAWVGEWIRDDEVHQTCRNVGKKCYGSKHRKVGASFFGSGGTWHELTNDPHNPL